MLGKINKPTIIVGDIKTALPEIVEIEKTSKNTRDLNIINQLDKIDIYRTFHPAMHIKFFFFK